LYCFDAVSSSSLFWRSVALCGSAARRIVVMPSSSSSSSSSSTLRQPMLSTVVSRSFASSPDDVVPKLTTEEVKKKKKKKNFKTPLKSFLFRKRKFDNIVVQRRFAPLSKKSTPTRWYASLWFSVVVYMFLFTLLSQIGRDMKIAKHPEQRFTTAILTNGATVFTRLPYYTYKYIRLEDDYISLAATQKTRPLPIKEKRVQPAKYARGRRRPKRSSE
jgi:hypothetical protein